MSTSTFERVSSPPPGANPADAAAEAARADERAAQAKVVADQAAKIAKEARAAAGAATREAAKLRDSVDPKVRDRADLSTAQAKQRLLEAARAIDPIGSIRSAVREHPFVTVGAALGTGAVVGTLGGTLGSLARLAFSVVKLGKPFALAGAQFAATRAAAKHAATNAPHQAAPSTGEPMAQSAGAVPPR